MTRDADDRDVLTALRLMLVAGHLPVTRLLTGGLAVLHTPRDRWQRLVDAPASTDATVEELLRIVTPIALASRYAERACPVGGASGAVAPGAGGEGGVVVVAPGEGVHCSLRAANRDPARFPDPDVFDPGRSPNPHLAFGRGGKHCLGSALARIECRTAFATLARRFPRLTLLGDGDAPAAVVLEPAVAR